MGGMDLGLYFILREGEQQQCVFAAGCEWWWFTSRVRVSESLLMSVTVTIVSVAVGTMNKTQLPDPSVEEDSGLVAGIVIAVVTVVLILAALVSE